jgi:hypothetical protein
LSTSGTAHISAVGPGGIGHVRVGACREQLLHEAGVAIQGGEHQRCRSPGAPQSNDGGIAAQHPIGGRAIAVSNQRNQALGFTVDLKRGRDTRERVWPFGALVDPGFHDRGAFAAWPALALIRIGKIAENATDYSLQNTLRQAVETFFWRAGDMLSAITILVVVQILGLGVRGFALINLAIVALWLQIGTNLKRENQKLAPLDEVAA